MFPPSQLLQQADLTDRRTRHTLVLELEADLLQSHDGTGCLCVAAFVDDAVRPFADLLYLGVPGARQTMSITRRVDTHRPPINSWAAGADAATWDVIDMLASAVFEVFAPVVASFPFVLPAREDVDGLCVSKDTFADVLETFGARMPAAEAFIESMEATDLRACAFSAIQSGR